MPHDLSKSLSAFIAESGGRASAARLRAILLDDAAVGGRVNRAEIEATVRAYELDVTRTPAEGWAALHARISAEIDDTSASVALDEWAQALGTSWRAVTTEVATESREGRVSGSRHNTVLVATAAVVAIVAIAAVWLATRGGDETRTSILSASTTTNTSSTPSTSSTIDSSSTIDVSSTTNTVDAIRSQQLFDLPWVPDAPVCQEQGQGTVPLIDFVIDPGAQAEVVCDFTSTSGVVVGLQLYTAGGRDTEYQRWLDLAGVARDAGADCPNSDTSGAANATDSESSFHQGAGPVGRILCRFDPSAGDAGLAYIVWYEDDLPYLGTIVSTDLDTAFAWWVNHGYGSDWDPDAPPESQRHPELLLGLDWVPDGCVDLVDATTMFGFESDPDGSAEVVCDLGPTSGVTVGLHLYPDNEGRDAAYQQWLDRAQVTRDSVDKCPSLGVAATEGIFQTNGVDAGRLLCLQYNPTAVSGFLSTAKAEEESIGLLVWVQNGLPYVGVVFASDLQTAFDWWSQHPFESTTPWS